MARRKRRGRLGEAVFTQGYNECEKRWKGKPGAIFICKDALTKLAKLMVKEKVQVCTTFCGCKPK